MLLYIHPSIHSSIFCCSGLHHRINKKLVLSDQDGHTRALLAILRIAHVIMTPCGQFAPLQQHDAETGATCCRERVKSFKSDYYSATVLIVRILTCHVVGLKVSYPDEKHPHIVSSAQDLLQVDGHGLYDRSGCAEGAKATDMLI